MLKKIFIVLSSVCILFVISSCKSSSKKDEAISQTPDIVAVDPTTPVSEIVTGLIPTTIAFNDKVFFIKVDNYIDLSKQIEGSTHQGFKVEKNTLNCLQQNLYYTEKDNTIRRSKVKKESTDKNDYYVISKYWYALEADATTPPQLTRQTATSETYTITSGGPIPENLTKINVSKKLTIVNCQDKIGYTLTR